MKSLDKEVFVCLDCEFTGLDSQQDRIIEVAAMRFSMKEDFETFDSLIDPLIPIPESSIAIHHITEEMVAGQPTIDKVLPDLIKFIGRDTLVGHGIGYDVEMLMLAAERAGIQTTLRNNLQLDTLRMARLYGDSPTNSLDQLRKHFNVSYEGTHRALSDVLVNRDVFRHLAKRYKTLEQIQESLSKPIFMKIMPLGKHKGRPLKEIRIEYLIWASKKDFDQDLIYSLKMEIKRRKKGNLFSQAANPFQNL